MKCPFSCSQEQSHSPILKTLGLVTGGLALTGLGVYLYASRIESRRFRLETVEVATPGGARQPVEPKKNGDARPHFTRNLKILHISDLHLHAPEREKVQFLRRCYEHEYDMVVLTGDIFENYSGIRYAQDLLARPPRLGAFAVLGNHDYYHYSWFSKVAGRIHPKYRPKVRRDVLPMIDALQETGFVVLQNEAHALDDFGIYVVGVDYPGIKESELRNLVSRAPAGHFVLALFHLPINLEAFARAGVHLAVGGHTHGGQIRLPGLGALITDSELGRKEASGLTWRGNTAIHVSRGLGADPRTNFRLFCPPAATVLDVTHTQPAYAPR